MKVFVSAGEVSGDQALGGILAVLRPAFPGLALCGLGGEAASRQGLEPLMPMVKTAVSGVGDVMLSAFNLMEARRKALRCLESPMGKDRGRPDLAILVDYPGLNLRLARRARELGIPAYFVAPPQAWIYRNPAAKAARASRYLSGSTLHVLFPFEKEIFSAVAARVVSGHFLEDALRASESRSGPSLAGRRNLLGLLPGSRLPALRRNLPAWLSALDRAGILPGGPSAGNLEAVTVLVPPHLEAEAKALVRSASRPGGSPPPEVVTDKGRLLREARWAIAFPGTITLELALAGIPAAVMAALDPLTLALGRRVVKGPWLGLPNLLLGREAFPEWVGTASALTPGVAANLWDRLREPATGAAEASRDRLRDLMGPAIGPQVAAAECLKILEKCD